VAALDCLYPSHRTSGHYMQLILPRSRLLTTMAALSNRAASYQASSLVPVVFSDPQQLPRLQTTKKTTVVWFRNNLRLQDNPALVAACEAATARGEYLLPLVCLDAEDTLTKATRFGNRKSCARRTAFMLESVADLQRQLKAKGSDLLVTSMPASACLEHLCSANTQDPNGSGNAGGSVSAVHVATEVASEELKAEKAVERVLKQRLVRHWDHTLYHLDDLPGNSKPDAMPLAFTPWRNKVEGGATIRPPLAVPKAFPPLPPSFAEGPSSAAPPSSANNDATITMEALLLQLGYSPEEARDHKQDDKAALQFRGGEEAALARLEGWVFQRDCLKDYFETRNGMLGPDYSTKFAPWLALGCLSPRTVYSEIKRYERSTGIENKSTYWVVFELVWRDFFRFMALKVGDKLFALTGPIPPKGQGAQSWRDPQRDVQAREALAAWKEGRTGQPLVDANMRELAVTGFMSNRGRQNVASFLVHDLNLDWRSGADWFESSLLDYDVGSNWGNWVAMAGLTGGRVNRFNIIKQTRDYDPSGAYLHHWIPELKNVPAPKVFEPWLLSAQLQDAAGVAIGSNSPAKAGGASVSVATYPLPIPTPGAIQAFSGKGGNKGNSEANKNGGGGGKGYKAPKSGPGGGGEGAGRNRGGGGGGGRRDDTGRSKRGSRVQSNYMGDFE